MVETIIVNSRESKTVYDVDTEVCNNPSSKAPHNAHKSATLVLNTTSQQPLNNCALNYKNTIIAKPCGSRQMSGRRL